MTIGGIRFKAVPDRDTNHESCSRCAMEGPCQDNWITGDLTRAELKAGIDCAETLHHYEVEVNDGRA